MAIIPISNSGKIHYAVKHYNCDQVSDVQNLPVDGVWVGSTAYVIATGDTYMFNGDKRWIRIANGGGGGSSAGMAATIQVGEVTTGAAGSDVTISNSGDEHAAIFDFSIPRGDPWKIAKVYDSAAAMEADYDNPDIAVGDLVCIVSDPSDPDNAKVYVKGDTQYEFFVDMSGATGIKGEDGAKGEKGDKGDKGDAFIYSDFTEDQLAGLKGDTGVGISSIALDPATFELIVTYSDGDTERVDGSIQGPQGVKGDTGEAGSSIKTITSIEMTVSGETVPGVRVTLTDGSYNDFALPKGPQGEDGAGITRIESNLDGTLSIYYGDSEEPVVTEPLKGDKGDKGDAFKYTDFTPTQLANLKGADGAVGPQGPQGIQGPKGDGLTIKKTYADQAEMLADAGNPDLGDGDMVITKDDGKLYVYDAENEQFTQVIDLSSVETIEGPMGPQGIPGPQGPTGPQGEVGPHPTGLDVNQDGNIVIEMSNGDIIVTPDSLNEYWMRIHNPEGDGSMSMNRKADTTIGAYSTTFGKDSEASGDYSFAAGDKAEATGNGSIALGNFAQATGAGSIAIGQSSIAQGSNSVSLGYNNMAIGEESFATGAFNQADGLASFAIGHTTGATGQYSCSTGDQTNANGLGSHSEGFSTDANGRYSHAEGYNTEAIGNSSHSEGEGTKANGQISHSEGLASEANEICSHAEGAYTKANGQGSHAEGQHSQALKNFSHAEGVDSIARNLGSHAEGNQTQAYGEFSHSEGNNTIAYKTYSHAEGNQTTARGEVSHVEGKQTVAYAEGSHAEGLQTTAAGNYSHAEGQSTQAIGIVSHAEGISAVAQGNYSHAEGQSTVSTGVSSHAEGRDTTAAGANSHTEGLGTIAPADNQHVSGQYNVADTQQAVIVGNGISNDDRSNAYTLDWEGNERIAGQGYIYEKQPVISLVSNNLSTGGKFDIMACMDGDYIIWEQDIKDFPDNVTEGDGHMLQKRTSAGGSAYFILTEFDTNRMWVGSGTSTSVTWREIGGN